MTLTESGEKLLSRVSGIIRQLEQAVDEVRSSSESITGNVAIGLMPSINSVLAVRLIEKVKSELPQVTLRIVEGYSGHLIEWLHRGDLDISFLYGPAHDLHLRCTGLLYENIALISAPGKLNNLGKEIQLSDIAHLPIVLPSRPHGIRILVDNAVAKAGVKLNVEISGDAFEVLKSLVKTGNYHAFIPLSAVNEDIREGTLEARTFISPTIKRQLVLAMAPDRKNTRAAQATLKIITSEIEKMVGEGIWSAELDAG